MIIYLTGATGLAGSAIAEAGARRGHTIIGIGFKNEIVPPGVSKMLRLDLTEEDQVIDSLLEHFPEVIINAAAISEPDICDQNPEASRKLNVALPATLARLSHHLSARLIHLSTDMVFDGCRGDYAPDSPTGPTSTYGHQKLDAEREVMKRTPEFATILRTTLLTGNSPSGRRSAHEKLFATWAAGNTARLFYDEIRQPCLANNLADVVIEISERNDLFGIFHWAGSEKISRYEIGRSILEHFKLPRNLIEKTALQSNPDFVGRPKNLTLDIGQLSRLLKTKPLAFSGQVDALKVPLPVRPWYHSQSPETG